MNETELEFHILNLLDGNLSNEEFMALQEELLRNIQARRVFKRFAHLHSNLETRYVSTAKIQQMGVVPVERIIANQRKRLLKWSVITAAAILAISAVSMWLILAPNPQAPIATFRTTSTSEFTITHAEEGAEVEGNALTEGSKVHLVHGTLEGLFSNGVRFVAEAPCRFRVLGENRVEFNEGVSWFQVPAKAVGFAVETEQMTIVDLGTEFGVVASSHDGDEIHVSKGSVEVLVSKEGGEKQILQAGQARRVTPDGRLLIIGSNTSRFRTELPRTFPITIMNHSFEVDDVSGLTNNCNPDIIPTGWSQFDDGRNVSLAGNLRGLFSHAPGSFVNESLGATPDPEDADQSFFTAQRDLYQVLSGKLQANSIYTLKVDIGDRRTKGIAGNPGTPAIRIGTGSSPGISLMKPRTIYQPQQIDGDWVTWTMVYETGSNPTSLGERLRVELTNGTNAGWFDNVRLSVTSSSK